MNKFTAGSNRLSSRQISISFLSIFMSTKLRHTVMTSLLLSSRNIVIHLPLWYVTDHPPLLIFHVPQFIGDVSSRFQNKIGWSSLNIVGYLYNINFHEIHLWCYTRPLDNQLAKPSYQHILLPIEIAFPGVKTISPESCVN